MAGYAYPVGATTTEYPAKTINVTAVSGLGDHYDDGIGWIFGSSVNPITTKTRINSIYLNNISGGILPVQLWRGQVSDMNEYDILHSTRVHKTKFMLLPLLSEDTRVAGETAVAEPLMNEIVLAPGDYLAVVCPVDNAVVATVNVSIGVK
jgi:hypothetical protein